MIEISEETAELLWKWVSDAHANISGEEAASVIRGGIPRPRPKHEPCPWCGGRAELRGDAMGCISVGCHMYGPDDDYDGAKWDAMARPARVLKEVEEWARDALSHTDAADFGDVDTRDDRHTSECWRDAIHQSARNVLDIIERKP